MDWSRTNTIDPDAMGGSGRRSPTALGRRSTPECPSSGSLRWPVALASDPWINIPPYVDDDYVRQFARLAKEKLAPNSKLNLEYSNETWNYMFSAAQWMLNKAKATWPAEVAKGTSPYLLQTNWYALRTAQVCKIVKAEFGADASKVRCIVNAPASNAWATDQLMQCTYATKLLGQPCNKIFDVIAIAPYFGFYVGDPKYRSVISSWYKDADGGLEKLFQEITAKNSKGQPVTPPLLSLGTNAPQGAVGQSHMMTAANKAVADKHGLPVWSYEGGQHLIIYPGDNDTNFLQLLYAANRDPRMAQAYSMMMQDWKNDGGQVFTFYSHASQYSKYGMWGLKENQFKSEPKWDAALKWRDQVPCWWTGCTAP